MAMLRPGTQTIRFRHPTAPSSPSSGSNEQPKPTQQHVRVRRLPAGVFPPTAKDLRNPPWCPSFSGAFRILILVRVLSAMYRVAGDCDEVFNYLEPLHLLARSLPLYPSSSSPPPLPFQTWEYTPASSLRSYLYLILHLPFAILPSPLSISDKRIQFFGLRIGLAVVSSLVESWWYRWVVERVGTRVGRYALVGMVGAAGLWEASTAFLPSTFAYYFVTLALSFSLPPPNPPSPSSTPTPPIQPPPFFLGIPRHIFLPTLLFSIAALVGWPFAIVMAVPYVIQQIWWEEVNPAKWKTFWWFVQSAVVSAVGILIPQILIDSYFYNKLTFSTLNLLRYNLLLNQSHLYGVEPPHFYLLNLFLNFNFLLPLFLLSLPTLLLSVRYVPRHLGIHPSKRFEGGNQETKRLVGVLASGYLWFGTLSLQGHKEERFGFPGYAVLVTGAMTTVYLWRCWGERWYGDWVKSEYKASKSSMYRLFTSGFLLLVTIFSASRILATHKYFHSPLSIYYHFQYNELPRLATSTFPQLYPNYDFSIPPHQQEERIDLSPLSELNLTLCIGKEWYRFPGSFLVPDEVRTEWIRSEFQGILPRRWNGDGEGKGVWNGQVTGLERGGFNERNVEEMDRYVPISTCSYLIDSDFPSRYPADDNSVITDVAPREPRYVLDEKNWDRVVCEKFLDSRASSRMTRAFWMPGEWWERANKWGEVCLLRRKGQGELRYW